MKVHLTVAMDVVDPKTRMGADGDREEIAEELELLLVNEILPTEALGPVQLVNVEVANTEGCTGYE